MKNTRTSLVVCKFGGTSMGSASAMKASAKIAKEEKAKLCVVSAVSGTTDVLLLAARSAVRAELQTVKSQLFEILSRHEKIAADLNARKELSVEMTHLHRDLELTLKGIELLGEASPRAIDKVLSFGERMSSLLFTQALRNEEIDCELLDSRKFIITDSQFGQASPLPEEIGKRVESAELKQKLASRVFVTQGFIGATEEGATTTLGRGGSDYSAALWAEALQADVCQIWTDVPGVYSTDPRLYDRACLLPSLSFAEMLELSSLGAKVLHPGTLLPAMRSNIPVYVGSTFEPAKGGTLILGQTESAPKVRSLALKKNQIVITLSQPQMADAHGFLYRMYKVFHEQRVSVDAITTSQISVAMTVDGGLRDLKTLIQELSTLGEVAVEEGYSLISIIGPRVSEVTALHQRIVSGLRETQTRMVCLGASRFSVSIVVKDKEGADLVRDLHKALIDDLVV